MEVVRRPSRREGAACRASRAESRLIARWAVKAASLPVASSIKPALRLNCFTRAERPRAVGQRRLPQSLVPFGVFTADSGGEIFQGPGPALSPHTRSWPQARNFYSSRALLPMTWFPRQH